MRILHVGDLHFWRIPRNPLLCLNKRLLGVGNLLVGGRARRFHQHLAPTLAQQLGQLGPDLFLFSGDFSSTALATEFAAARSILESVVRSAPHTAISVPGNHDCYIPSEIHGPTFANQLGPTFRPTTGFDWHAYPQANLFIAAFNAGASNGLNSFGRIRTDHVDQFARHLEALPTGAHLVILCHFPPEVPPAIVHHDRGEQLLEYRRLMDLIGTVPGTVLWLHGHDHHRWIHRSPTKSNVVYLNAGAPMLSRSGRVPDLGFHEITINASLEIRTHRRNPDTGEWTAVPVDLPAEPGQHFDLQQ